MARWAPVSPCRRVPGDPGVSKSSRDSSVASPKGRTGAWREPGQPFLSLVSGHVLPVRSPCNQQPWKRERWDCCSDLRGAGTIRTPALSIFELENARQCLGRFF